MLSLLGYFIRLGYVIDASSRHRYHYNGGRYRYDACNHNGGGYRYDMHAKNARARILLRERRYVNMVCHIGP